MEKKHRAPGTMQLGDANKQGGRGGVRSFGHMSIRSWSGLCSLRGTWCMFFYRSTHVGPYNSAFFL